MDLRPETQTSIALAADVFTLLALAAPLFTAMPAIYKTNTVGRRSPLPNIAALLGCCVGILYGCARHDRLAIAVSSVGAFLQAVYVAFFLCYTAARPLVLLQCLVPALAYVATLTWYLLVGAADADTLAFMAGACGCLVPATIGYNLVVKVRKEMNMDCMPHPIVPALSLVSAPLWILYAYAGKDPKLYIAIPNYIGLAFALLQVFLHSWFWYQVQLKSDVDAALRECLLEIAADGC